MNRLVIEGGRPLCGSLSVQGAKNAVLPILAATVLCDRGVNIIHNCPRLRDVEATLAILRHLGIKIKRKGDTVLVDSRGYVRHKIPKKLMHKLRSSVIFTGAIAARCKKAKISMPGGCELGPRPIDMHLEALRALGCDIKESQSYIKVTAKNLKGTTITLRFPSVGATENILLAACKAKGITVIENAAKEPEIEDLASFLNAMGADIRGAGSERIEIHGTESLSGTEYAIMSDRIVAITYLCCAAATGGHITLNRINPAHIEPALSVLAQCGCYIEAKEDSVFLSAPEKLTASATIETAPYPGFPTDAQSLFLALFTTTEGVGTINEKIFESRFRTANELIKMGAKIKTEGGQATVFGVPTLYGAEVNASDLRGGAAMVIAALGAKGVTTINHVCYIDRGYEKIEENLSRLGACIWRV